MILQDISFSSPKENILLDEVLFYLAEQGEGGEVLRFWESRQDFVVLGRIGKEDDDLNFEALLKDNIPVLRRSSGGGTVVQGKGCLNYALILSKGHDPRLHDIKGSYQFILGKIILALENIGVAAVFQPTSDLALKKNNKKFSGNAQKRGKKFILHHGTVLYDFDLKKIEKYLQFPRETPAYRLGRSHLEFVANITVDPNILKKSLKGVFGIHEEKRTLDAKQSACLRHFIDNRNIAIDLSKTIAQLF